MTTASGWVLCLPIPRVCVSPLTRLYAVACWCGEGHSGRVLLVGSAAMWEDRWLLGQHDNARLADWAFTWLCAVRAAGLLHAPRTARRCTCGWRLGLQRRQDCDAH